MLIDLFKGKRIRLTAPRDSDKVLFEKWCEDSNFMRMIDTEIAYPAYREDMLPPASNTAYEFRIRLLDTDELIGFTAIHGIEWNNQVGTFSIGIGSVAHRGKGYGGEAISLTLGFAFRELNLHRIGLEFIAYNENAQKAYERAGFEVEGVSRECVYRDGKRFDRISMGITRPKWEILDNKPLR